MIKDELVLVAEPGDEDTYATLEKVKQDVMSKLLETDVKKFTTNLQLGSLIQDINGFVPSSTKPDENSNNPFHLGTVGGIEFYVNPSLRWNDTRFISKNVELTITASFSII